MAKKNYVIDTSVFLTDADSINKFDNHDIIVPLKVLEEIDKHKKRQDSVGFNARQIIKTFDCLRIMRQIRYFSIVQNINLAFIILAKTQIVWSSQSQIYM